MQSVTLTSSLIPSELVISETAIDTVLPTQWNHAQAPRFNVVNASSRVYEDELGVLTISELSVAELDATAPDVDVSLEVLLPQNCNLSSFDARERVPPRVCVCKPTLSIMMTNSSTNEDGVFTGAISVVPTKADVLFRIQVMYPSSYISQVASTSTSPRWSTGAAGISGSLLSSFSTTLGVGVGDVLTTELSLKPITKISGNISVDVMVVTSTVDVAQDFFISDCYQRVSSSSGVFECIPSSQRKSLAVTSQSIDLVIYPVAEAPRLDVTPAVLSITENGEAFVTLSNWTLTDIDGSERMDLRLRCTPTAWKKVLVDGILSNSSIQDAATTTTFELLSVGVYGGEKSIDLKVQLSPPSYYSGSIDCSFASHAIDRSGGFVSEDTYETQLSVTVVAEATAPLVSITSTNFTAVEDGVAVCDSVTASLVDVDGSEALFLVVNPGEYEQFVTSVTWRSEDTVMPFSAKADGVVPTMVYSSPTQRVVAAGSGRVEMHGSVEIGLATGYSGELRLSIASVSLEKIYLASTVASDVAVAHASSIDITVAISPICHVANVELSPVSAVTKPSVAVPVQVIASTIDTDGSEVLAAEVSVNRSAVLSLYGTNASENWLTDSDLVTLPRLPTQDVFHGDQTFTVVPRAEFVGFFIVNVTVKTTELATGEIKFKTVVATVLVTSVDPVVRVSAVSRGSWNEFIHLPFQRLDIQQEDVTRENLLLYVENRTQVADVYAGFMRLTPVTLGAVNVYVVPYTLRDVVSVRPPQYWYGSVKLFAIVTTVAFDVVSTPNRTAYQGTGDGIVIIDLPVIIHPRPVSPSYSLATSSDVSVSGKPISVTFNAVLPSDAWGSSTGGMATQLVVAPFSFTDSVSVNRTVTVSKAAVRGARAYGTNSSSSITTVANGSNSKAQLIGEADRGMLGFGETIRVFRVEDNQNVTFRLADFGLMSELTDLVSVQAFIMENAVDAVVIGSTQLNGDTDSQWGATVQFRDSRYELYGNKSPACLGDVEPACLLDRVVTITPRRYTAQTFDMTIRVTSRVSANDSFFGSLSTVTTIARCRVTVAPVPNTPLLVLNTTAVTTLEDTAAAFSILEASTPDRDGSEVIEVEMSFDPHYLDTIQVDGVAVTTSTVADTVVLIPRSAAVSSVANRVVSLRPRRNFDGNFTIQLAVASIELSTGERTRVSTNVTVAVVAVADAPVLRIGTSELHVNQNVAAELTITSVGLTDDDNSETLRLVVVDPSRSALKTVEVIGGEPFVKSSAVSTFVLPLVHLPTLTLRLTTIGTWFGSTQLQINAVSRESTNGNEVTTTAFVTFTVYPVADAPTLVVENTQGQLTRPARIGLVSVGIPIECKLNATLLNVYLLPRSSDAIEVKWHSRRLP
ncbi:uncharacterized protein PITG_19641 [Phytophthora infestans T30-4]|uniref:GPS domain-containing protein n=1 Tax=Phytophthora infestans (strain T30-4) TaxID=403677 RepID=D0P0H3_PHYIT|nr:uncharacterized protein PITG_19641 [Phytophthora infestans T30-4]EEY52935.1 conserved hypothetical protein [Phytophthora infestans T30-4]|eukprot:XP_002896202.1 conserved hypothetical protein [Phytophthora infestans T30-4]